jgi:hypothetical protein
MRVPRFRFSLRGLLIFVAIFAIVLVAGTRSYKYRWKAGRRRYHASQFAAGSDVEQREAEFIEAYLAAQNGTGAPVKLLAVEESRLERAGDKALRERVAQARGNVTTYAALARYNTKMARLYDRAAWLPWSAVPNDSWSVSPDPPSAE